MAFEKIYNKEYFIQEIKRKSTTIKDVFDYFNALDKEEVLRQHQEFENKYNFLEGLDVCYTHLMFFIFFREKVDQSFSFFSQQIVKKFTMAHWDNENNNTSTFSRDVNYLAGGKNNGNNVCSHQLHDKYIEFMINSGGLLKDETLISDAVKEIGLFLIDLQGKSPYRENKKVQRTINNFISFAQENFDSKFDGRNKLLIILSDVDIKVDRAVSKSKKRQIIFTGAPGTGKTYCVEEFVKDVTGEDELNGKRSRFVQFHSSYDYTDFVEGLRPINFDGKMEFVRMDGVFKEFCRKIILENNGFAVSSDFNGNYPDYYFVIDEINRADLGKVFGELMYCFEKRGEEHKVKTQYANLPEYMIDPDTKEVVRIWGDYDVFKDGFYIPDNLIILCTMNDIDRSVETFDFALRRRFDWVEINANDVMASSLNCILGDIKELPDIIKKAKAVNKLIENQSGLGKDYMIGPAYFKDYDGGKVTLDNIWENNIEPILREYLRGRSNCDDFVKECKIAFDNAKDEE